MIGGPLPCLPQIGRLQNTRVAMRTSAATTSGRPPMAARLNDHKVRICSATDASASGQAIEMTGTSQATNISPTQNAVFTTYRMSARSAYPLLHVTSPHGSTSLLSLKQHPTAARLPLARAAAGEHAFGEDRGRAGPRSRAEHPRVGASLNVLRRNPCRVVPAHAVHACARMRVAGAQVEPIHRHAVPKIRKRGAK
jgi:hypothetical protein